MKLSSAIVNHHQTGRRTTLRRRIKEHKTEEQKTTRSHSQSYHREGRKETRRRRIAKEKNKNNRNKTKPATAAAEPPRVAHHGLAQGGPEKRIPDKGNCCSRVQPAQPNRGLWQGASHLGLTPKKELVACVRNLEKNYE